MTPVPKTGKKPYTVKMDARQFSAEDLTKANLARTEEVNSVFHAALEVNQEAVSIAKALDEEMKVTRRRGPLHGIPILIRDNIVIGDQMEATAGSMALLGAKPRGECSTVTNLRNAGVVNLRSEEDQATWKIPFDQIPDFSRSCGNTDLSAIKIGIPRNTFSQVPASVMSVFEDALATLKGLGAEILTTNFLSAGEYEKIDDQTDDVVNTAEFHFDLGSDLASMENNPHQLSSVADVNEFTKTCPEECYHNYNVGMMSRCLEGGANIHSERYKSARERERSVCGTNGILGTMEKFELDVVAFPTGFSCPTPLSYATKLGLPVISIPLGFYPKGVEPNVEMTDQGILASGPGMPFAIFFAGKAFSEMTLLKVAYAFKQATRVRAEGPSPYLVSTTELKDIQEKERKRT